MCKDTHGILPKFKSLKDAFTQLISEIQPILESSESSEHFNHIKVMIEKIYFKMKELPNELNQSYEMIQLVIHSIHNSRNELKKSVDGLIKKTGVQLKKITSTTEEATNKIMDTAEKLDEEQENIVKLVEKLSENATEEDIIIIDQIKEKLYQNQDSAFQIIDFLQFQDITAQQIAGAYSLLADTEKTLIQVSNMLMRFDPNIDIQKHHESNIDKNSFNADANFTDKGKIQDAIDDIFSSGDTGVDVPEDESIETKDIAATSDNESIIDNDSIDALFNDKKEEVDIDSLFESNQKKSSQDDIDDLFGKEKDKKKSDVSQDDIDALFS